jgi:CRP/FNR family transcriptional regulator
MLKKKKSASIHLGDQLEEIIRGFPLFSFLDQETIHGLLEVSIVCYYEKGAQFRFEGQRAHLGMVVLLGRIALIKQLPRGKKLTVETLSPGDWYGLTPLVSQGIYPVFLSAEEPSYVLCVTKKAIHDVCMTQPDVYDEFLAELQTRLDFTQDRLLLATRASIEARMAAMIVKLVELIGVRKPSLRCQELSLSRRELADLVGTSVETAIRTTKVWEREGIIKIPSKGNIQVYDLNYLRSLCAQSTRKCAEDD